MASPLLDLLMKMDENLSLMCRHLDNIQNRMSTCTQTFTKGQACSDVAESPLKAEEVEDSMPDSALHQGHSSPVDDSKVMMLLDTPICKSLPTNPFTFLEVSNGCIGPYPPESKNIEEERTRAHAYKVFATIPDWEIDLKIDATEKTNSLTTETKDFNKVFQSFSAGRFESSDLIMFDNQLALHCMPFVRNSNKFICKGINRIIDYSSELGQVALVLLLHRFPPGHVGLQFPFDPGSCCLTTSSLGDSFLNRIHYVSVVIVQLNESLNKKLAQGSSWEFDVFDDELSNAPFTFPVIEFDVVLGYLVHTRVFRYSFHGLDIEFPRQFRVFCGGRAYEVQNEMKNYPGLEYTHVNPVTEFYGRTAIVICIWDLGKCYVSMALIGYPVHLTPLLLLGSPTMFFFIMCANYVIKVWNLGQWSMCVYFLQFYSTLPGPNSPTFYQMFTDKSDIFTKLASRGTVLIPWRKELVLLLALAAQRKLQQLGMVLSEKCGLTVITEGFGCYLTEYYFKRMPRAQYYGLCKISHSLFSINLLNILESDLFSTIVDFCLGEKLKSGYSKHFDDAKNLAYDYFREVFFLLSVDCFRELEFDIISFEIWLELYLPFVLVGVIVFGQASRDDATLMIAIPIAILLELIVPKLVFIQDCNTFLHITSWAVCGGHQHNIGVNMQFCLLQVLPGALLKKVIVELILTENLIRSMSIANVLNDLHSAVNVMVLRVNSFCNGALKFDQVTVVIEAYPSRPSLLQFLGLNLEDKVLIEGGSNVMNGA